MENLSDEAIMQKVAMGNIEHLGLLYERHKQSLYNFFYRRTRVKEISDDLIHETFIRIWKYSHTFKKGHNFKSWVYAISNNLLADHFKKNKHTVRSERLSEENHAEEKETTLDNSDLNIMLNKLNTKDQHIVSMYYFAEMSHKEIAEALDITVNSSRIKLSRALKKLSRLMVNK